MSYFIWPGNTKDLSSPSIALEKGGRIKDLLGRGVNNSVSSYITQIANKPKLRNVILF